MGHERDYSEEVAGVVDEEVKRLIETAHDEAWEILVENRDVLDNLVLALLERETLDKAAVAEIFAGSPQAPGRARPGPARPRARPAARARCSPPRSSAAAANGHPVSSERVTRWGCPTRWTSRTPRCRSAEAGRRTDPASMADAGDAARRRQPARASRRRGAFDGPRAEAAVRELLIAIGEDPDREGLRETPARVARAYREIFAGLYQDPRTC